METKICAECKEAKGVSEFYRGSNGQRYRAKCKRCISAKNKAWYERTGHITRQRYRERYATLSEEERAKHRERVREYHRRAKYGLDNAQWNRMLEMQDGLCGICGNRNGTHLDHSHDTGENRMLLCNQCNQLLGFAADSPHILRAAADYLESY